MEPSEELLRLLAERLAKEPTDEESEEFDQAMRNFFRGRQSDGSAPPPGVII